MAIQVGHDVKRRAALISLGMREEQSADETGESAETITIQFFLFASLSQFEKQLQSALLWSTGGTRDGRVQLQTLYVKAILCPFFIALPIMNVHFYF